MHSPSRRSSQSTDDTASLFTQLPILASTAVLIFMTAISLGVVVGEFQPGSTTELRSDASNAEMGGYQSDAIFVAPAAPSRENTVDTQAVAAKLDLQRKVVQTNGNTETIRQEIEANGGEILSSSDGQVVARFPKENSEQIEKQIEAAGGRAETDYPVAIAVDTPDWGVQRIEADEVWETTQASGVRIAVVDTGVDYTHPELSARYAGGYDFVNEDDDPQDDNGHGTHVAGIASSSLNDAGIAGAAPATAVYGLKTMGSDGTGYISDIIEAIDWAIANDMNVINLSIGTTYDSFLLEDALNRAAENGIVSVAAAGNTSGDAQLYPAAYGSVIGVSATDQNDNFASFSSLGAEVAAPGVGIRSTLPGGGYGTLSGTSMASPHVAATVALMLSEEVSDVRTQLRDTAIDLGPSGRDNYFGYGLVQADEATLGADTQAPIVSFIQPSEDTTIGGSVTIEVSIQDENEVTAADLRVNGSVVTTWDAAPYTYEWDTAGLAPGTYEVVATATDDSANVGQARLMFDVQGDNVFKEPRPSTSSGVTDGARQRLLDSDANEEALRRVPQDPGQSGNARERSQGDQDLEQDIPYESNREQRNPRPTRRPTLDDDTDDTSAEESTSTESIEQNTQPGRGSAGGGRPDDLPGNAGRGAVRGAQDSVPLWERLLQVIR